MRPWLSTVPTELFEAVGALHVFASQMFFDETFAVGTVFGVCIVRPFFEPTKFSVSFGMLLTCEIGMSFFAESAKILVAIVASNRSAFFIVFWLEDKRVATLGKGTVHDVVHVPECSGKRH